jgi:GNAT superfamily N-acetyltransferase
VRQYPGVLGYSISTDPNRLNRALVHRWLSEVSYWARGRPRDVQDRAIDGSLCFGLYAPDGAQAGFARAVTDYATYGWLADVFVLEEHRGRGLGLWLVRTAVEHPELRGLRWHLMTDDAHSLYAVLGFTAAPHPERLMVRGDA